MPPKRITATSAAIMLGIATYTSTYPAGRGVAGALLALIVAGQALAQSNPLYIRFNPSATKGALIALTAWATESECSSRPCG